MNLRHTLLLLLPLLLPAKTWAQSAIDSADIFYRHLDLNEVVITGLTGDTKLRNSPAPVAVVGVGQLRATAATSAVDAIAHEPGLAQLTTGSGISKPIIRGLGYNRIVCMADGIRQEGQQWGDEHGLEIDANAVGSVEILKGPASLMYGSDAMAGVLIFKPKVLPAEGDQVLSASTEYQTNNGLMGFSAEAGGQRNGAVLYFQLSAKQAHAYRNHRDGYVPNTQFAETAGTGLAGINRSWGHSHLRISIYQTTPSMAEGERDETTGRLLTAPGHRLKSYNHSLPYQRVEHNKVVWDNAVYLGRGQLKAIVGFQQNRRKEFEEDEDYYDLYLRQNTLNYDFRYLLDTDGGWQFATGLGGMLQRSVNKGEEHLIPDNRLADIGLFATATRDLGRWLLSGGARIDHRHLRSHAMLDDEGELQFSRLGRNFTGATGSLGAVFHASDALNFRLNVARGFRTPNISELASNGVHEGTLRYEVGNSALRAEYSLQADLGLDFSSRYVSAQLALFCNRIDNFIFAARTDQQPVDAEFPVYQFRQTDARLMGFEAGIDLHPVHSLHFGSTFSLVDARLLRQPADRRYLPLTPAPRLTLDLKYELTHDGQHLNNTYVAVGTEHTLCQTHIYSADATETPTPGYTLFNASVGTDILVRGQKFCELHIVGTNLLNKSYQSHLSRLKYTEPNPLTGRTGICNMGRNLTFKLIFPFAPHQR